MPYHKLKLFFTLLLALGGLPGCYTFEFFPDENYVNLRRNNIEEVEVVYKRPKREFEKLGVLVGKNFNGSLTDKNFIIYVKKNARKYGAQGAWITRTRLKRYTGFQTRSANYRQRNNSHQQIHGSVDREFGEMKIILFNYRDSNSK